MNRVLLLLNVVMWQSSLYTDVWSGQPNFIPWMSGEPAWKHLPSASVFVYQLCHCSGCFNLSCPCWFMSWENWESGSYSLCSQFRRFGHLLSFCTFCPVNLWGTWETFHVWSVALARNIAMKYESCSRDIKVCLWCEVSSHNAKFSLSAKIHVPFLHQGLNKSWYLIGVLVLAWGVLPDCPKGFVEPLPIRPESLMVLLSNHKKIHEEKWHVLFEN